MVRQNYHVQAIDSTIDYDLRPWLSRGQRVLPARRDELHAGPFAEAVVQFVDDLVQRPPLDCQIAWRGDEDGNLSRLGSGLEHRVRYHSNKSSDI